MVFLANKSMGIIHWHPEISQKVVILCSETSKCWSQNGHFCNPNTPTHNTSHVSYYRQSLALGPKNFDLKRFEND